MPPCSSTLKFYHRRPLSRPMLCASHSSHLHCSMPPIVTRGTLLATSTSQRLFFLSVSSSSSSFPPSLSVCSLSLSLSHAQPPISMASSLRHPEPTVSSSHAAKLRHIFLLNGASGFSSSMGKLQPPNFISSYFCEPRLFKKKLYYFIAMLFV
ncbi:hypothetical protein CIPAW_06G055900 [Carya illinoinensis]|uniref:Uncharacterized protein n=1 Tax=Carya illinoinensis TaxID=32201 RepID=A0A8T1Q854_CARIL|nr:hypothetical protein CIPAW_06G055900 [Carya illinoinensis]